MLCPNMDFNMGQQWHDIEQLMVSLAGRIISSPCRWQISDIVFFCVREHAPDLI